jgi:hypothetical protein
LRRREKCDGSGGDGTLARHYVRFAIRNARVARQSLVCKRVE